MDERPDDRAGSGSNQTPPGPARRFIEPYRFDDRQRGLIDAALDDAGIDERTARSIFIGAIAYELAVFKDAITAAAAQRPLAPTPSASEPAPPASEPAPPASEPAPFGSLPTAGTPTAADSGSAVATAAVHGSRGNDNGADSCAGGEAGPAVDRNRQASAAPLATVAGAAATLADLLAALDPLAREQLSARLRRADPFARSYGEDYLVALVAETRRIAAAGADALGTTPGAVQTGTAAAGPSPATLASPTAATSNPADQAAHEPSAVADHRRLPTPAVPSRPAHAAPSPLRQPVQHFIAHAARVYRECFDRAPGTAANDPFRLALAAIARATDTPIPTTVRVLKLALRN